MIIQEYKKQKNKQDEIVVQSNYLIESHYRLNLQEKRLILWLIKEIKKEDIDFRTYKLSITAFAEMMELNPQTQYKEMKKITKSLLTRSIEINDTKKDETIQITWLCFVKWENKKGICSLEFHPSLKPYLLQLQYYFTKIGFNDLLELKSIYSVRIFELLSQYEALGKRKMEIDNIRSWCGISDHEYRLYANLKSRVIERAKTEINAKTEYDVDYKEIKTSRKVTGIEWGIKKKPKSSKLLSLEQEASRSQFLIESLLSYGFSNAIAKRLIQNNEESVIKNAIKAVDLQIERGKVKNAKAMLQTAIKDQWHPEIFKTKKKKSCIDLVS